MSSSMIPPRRANRSDDTNSKRKSQQPACRQGGHTSSLYEEFSHLQVELDRDRGFQDTLDLRIAEQERLHSEALAQAAAEHERVRQGAERARELLELHLDKERVRREQIEKCELEAERQARIDREATELTRQKNELERQEQDQRKRAAEAQQIVAAKARLEEQQRRERIEAERRDKEHKEAEEKAQTAAQAETDKKAAGKAATAQPPSAPPPAPISAPPAVTNGTAPPAMTAAPHAHSPAASHLGVAPPNDVASGTQSTSTNPLLDRVKRQQREELHTRYLTLHKQLKEMRQSVTKEAKNVPALKKELGDWRRQIALKMGQVTTEVRGHQRPLTDITKILDAAARFAEPRVDVSSFIISTPTDGSPMYMSGPLVYLLNMVVKIAVQILTSLAWSVPEIGSPIAIVLLTIFAKLEYRYNRKISLIDILLAKFHFCCPVLWGIYGSQKTSQGRERLGWAKAEGNWVPEQRQMERTAGLAAGYAGLSLRDFSKASYDNPYPPRNYWRTFSLIVNIPPQEVQPIHFITLRSLIIVQIPTFIRFYGQAAVIALRKALVELPAQAPQTPERDAIILMHETTLKDLRLVLQ